MHGALGRSIIAVFALTVLGPASLAGQTDGGKGLPSGPALGASFDRYTFEGGGGITAITFRYSQLRPGRPGTEIGVSLFPEALAAGALFLAPDIGPAFNLSGPGFTLLAKGGMSALLGLGGGVGFAPGYHFGGGVILRGDDRTGIRVDVARHVYLMGNESLALWSVGLGFTVLPRRR